MSENDDEYKDIIDLKYPMLSTHPKMPKSNRAMQFAPFVSLRGYELIVNEKQRQRLINSEKDFCEDHLDALNYTISYLEDIIETEPFVLITYFVKDKSGKGGDFMQVSGCIEKIDSDKNIIQLEGNKMIRISDINDIDF